MVRIVTKGGTSQTHIGRFLISSCVPETSQGFHPDILDPLGLKQPAESILVEVREFTRTGISPDVGNDLDLEFLKKALEFFKGPV